MCSREMVLDVMVLCHYCSSSKALLNEQNKAGKMVSSQASAISVKIVLFI